MIVYNVTINVADEVHEDWLYWIRNEHIPAMLATGKFVKALMTKVITEEEMDGTSYSIQYTAASRYYLSRYYAEDAKRLQKGYERFKGNYVAFSTELEVVTEQVQIQSQ